MLPPRFLRHAPLLLVDSPAEESLQQIYGAFNAALLKLHPPLRGHLEGLTDAMIEFYNLNQVLLELRVQISDFVYLILKGLANGARRRRLSLCHLRAAGLVLLIAGFAGHPKAGCRQERYYDKDDQKEVIR